MFKRLDHFAIAVSNTEDALAIWRDKFNFPVLFSEKVNNDTVLLTHLDLGNTHLQLVQPLTADHPLHDWIKRNGGPGLHHFCLEVDNVSNSASDIKQHSLNPAPKIHQGTLGKRALFIDKNDTSGVQVELTGS